MMTVSPATVDQYANGVDYLYQLGFRYLICTIDYSGEWTEAAFRALERQYKRLAVWYQELTLREEKFYFSPFEVKISSHIHQRTYCAERCELGKKQLSVCPRRRDFPLRTVCGPSGISNWRCVLRHSARKTAAALCPE